MAGNESIRDRVFARSVEKLAGALFLFGDIEEAKARACLASALVLRQVDEDPDAIDPALARALAAWGKSGNLRAAASQIGKLKTAALDRLKDPGAHRSTAYLAMRRETPYDTLALIAARRGRARMSWNDLAALLTRIASPHGRWVVDPETNRIEYPSARVLRETAARFARECVEPLARDFWRNPGTFSHKKFAYVALTDPDLAVRLSASVTEPADRTGTWSHERFARYAASRGLGWSDGVERGMEIAPYLPLLLPVEPPSITRAIERLHEEIG